MAGKRISTSIEKYGKLRVKGNWKPGKVVWMSQFDQKTRMAMIALDGETLSCDGGGVLYACSIPVKLMPIPRKSRKESK